MILRITNLALVMPSWGEVGHFENYLPTMHGIPSHMEFLVVAHMDFLVAAYNSGAK